MGLELYNSIVSERELAYRAAQGTNTFSEAALEQFPARKAQVDRVHVGLFLLLAGTVTAIVLGACSLVLAMMGEPLYLLTLPVAGLMSFLLQRQAPSSIPGWVVTEGVKLAFEDYVSARDHLARRAYGTEQAAVVEANHGRVLDLMGRFMDAAASNVRDYDELELDEFYGLCARAHALSQMVQRANHLATVVEVELPKTDYTDLDLAALEIEDKVATLTVLEEVRAQPAKALKVPAPELLSPVEDECHSCSAYIKPGAYTCSPCYTDEIFSFADELFLDEEDEF